MVNYWLWVSKEDNIDDTQEASSSQRWNGCDEETEVGDYALIYRISPHKNIKYLVEVTKHSFLNTNKLPDEEYYCEFKVLSNFENELELKEMKEEESLSEWYPLKNKFHKKMFPLTEDYWKILKGMIQSKNHSPEEAT
jgi:predicted RNA-binding protein with PUA-like domain